ncbi:hypothetical protein PIB30_057264 [Stylosanthes scabra]|uniref:Uncharacterized protein n=1 Tax=Stylosanthes scabra TaxID=79078 RepID=A0ABU6XL88_9FABA|nr:hypothetical protein [Stylosanthes scabra]
MSKPEPERVKLGEYKASEGKSTKDSNKQNQIEVGNEIWQIREKQKEIETKQYTWRILIQKAENGETYFVELAEVSEEERGAEEVKDHEAKELEGWELELAANVQNTSKLKCRRQEDTQDMQMMETENARITEAEN